MKLVDKLKEFSNNLYLKARYKAKCRKLNITDSLLDIYIARYHSKEVKDFFRLVSKSKNKQEFNQNIISYYQNNHHPYMLDYLLLGTISGNYSFYTLSPIDKKSSFDFNNLLEQDYQDVLIILKKNFYQYLMNSNELKNSFLIDQEGNYNYTLDLNKEFCDRIFDECVSGKEYQNSDNYIHCYEIARNYIVMTIGIYGTENIKNHFDFIFYDFYRDSNHSLEERKRRFLNHKNLSSSQMSKIDNVEILIQKLKTISHEDAKKLFDRISYIQDDLENHIEELEAIYMDYEVLLRNDIISHLFKPSSDYTVVEDFRDLRPQLLHLFYRNPEKFRDSFENQMIEDIISQRQDKTNSNRELTEDERIELEKRKAKLEVELDVTQVNYSYDGKKLIYSDKSGYRHYHSETKNQLSTSLYSAKYYLENSKTLWSMGVGFNEEGLCPEAIALSSSIYLTTNMGLNNLEYSENDEFDLMSSTYSELEKNDGKSEIILFRRNMDYDTKASYLFLTIDSSQREKSEFYLKKASEMAEKNRMKLVVYDLYKIRNSYVTYLEEEAKLEMDNSFGKNK